MKKNRQGRSLGAIKLKLSLKMRLTLILLFLSLFRINANTYSQNTKITLDVKNVTIEEVFDIIKEKTEFKIFFKNSDIDLNREISFKTKKHNLDHILAVVFKNSNISYKVVDKQIVLNKKSPTNVSKKTQIQNIIKGVVKDPSGQPLIGVSIVKKGTAIGVETDFDGMFSIEAKEGDILVFSSLGYKKQEVTIANQKTLSVVLKEDVEFLNEVIVVTGYDRVSKRTFTGASTSVDMDEIKIEGVTDASRMLEGRVAGVNIQNVSGTFGAAPKITIRGSSSVFGNNNPLYVIDGVVQEDIVSVDLNGLTSGNAETLISSSLAGINANDIKSIDLLKDASATSLYGARARNGVVVIVTKNGSRDTPLKINYSLEETVRDIPNYANYDILNSKETVGVYREIESKGYLDLPSVAQARYGGIYYLMADRINTYNPQTGSFLLANTQEAKNGFLQQYELANTDWFKTLFRRSLTQTHSLSFTGGGENNSFYASLGYFSDPGWSIADKVDRLTANLKTTFFLSKKFNLTLSSTVSVRNQKAPGSFESKSDDFFGSISRNFDINPFSYALNTSRALRPKDSQGNLEYYRNNWAPLNILNEIDNNSIDLKVKDLTLKADGAYEISDKLSYNFSVSSRNVSSNFEHNIKRQSNVVGAYNADETTIVRNANIFLYQDLDNPTALPVAVLPRGGIYTKTDYELTSYYFRNSFQYDNIFNDKNEVSALFGQELRYVDRKRNSFTGYGLQYDRGFVPFTDARLLEKLISDGNDYFSLSEEKERTMALYGKATYTYDNRYTISATGRYDGSNRQGRTAASRWLPTGTISAKWNVTGEDFMSDVTGINSLKFRGSYGLVATPGSATNSLAIYQSGKTDRLLPSDRESFLNIQNLQNSELTWEKQYETNIGMDLGLYNNRIQLTVEAYKRDIFDNIDFVRTSGIGGEFIKQGNNADVISKGLEFSLNTINIATNNFKWSTNFNFSVFDAEITKLSNEPTVFDLVSGNGGNIEGYPINSLFSFDFKGLDSRGLPTFNLPEDTTNPNNAINGADFQDTEDILDYLVYEGSSNPNLTAGITNSFSYKNLDFSFFISASGGNKVRLNPAFSNAYSDLDVFTKDFSNRWVVPGDETVTNVPVITSRRVNNEIPNLQKAYNAYNYSNARIADGSFVRMKNISIGYSFNKQLTDKLGVDSFKIKLQGTNLFLLYSDSKLNGQDPEFFNTGGVAFPIKKQFTFSLNVSL